MQQCIIGKAYMHCCIIAEEYARALATQWTGENNFLVGVSLLHDCRFALLGGHLQSDAPIEQNRVITDLSAHVGRIECLDRVPD